MITRKLNLLQLNKVFDALANGTLVSLEIFKGKKDTHMISYHTTQEAVSERTGSHGPSTIELMRVLREIKKQVTNATYNSISLKYDHKKEILQYTMDLRE